MKAIQFILLVCLVLSIKAHMDFEEHIGWNTTKFTLPNNTIIECENCMPAGIKISKNNITGVSFPRGKENVIATLAKWDDTTKTFIPWPSYNENPTNDPNNLQSVLGFEIDDENQIYVLDQGRVNNQIVEGSAKLCVYNISGDLITTYFISEHVDQKSTFLNDVVIDPHRNIAYISNSGIPIDSSPYAPSIIVIFLDTREIIKTLENHPTIMPDESFWGNVNGEKVGKDSPMKTGVDGITLSCDYEILYYTPGTSNKIYSIRVKNLIDTEKKTPKDVKPEMIFSGFKNCSSDGILSSSRGNLYMTNLEAGSVYLESDIDDELTRFDYKLFQNYEGGVEMMWPDTLTLHDNHGYVLSNQLNNFITNQINSTNPKYGKANFRIYKKYVEDGSYIIGCKFFKIEWTLATITVWVCFAIIILIVLSFVLMSSHKQEEVIDKHMDIGFSQDDKEIENLQE